MSTLNENYTVHGESTQSDRIIMESNTDQEIPSDVDVILDIWDTVLCRVNIVEPSNGVITILHDGTYMINTSVTLTSAEDGSIFLNIVVNDGNITKIYSEYVRPPITTRVYTMSKTTITYLTAGTLVYIQVRQSSIDRKNANIRGGLYYNTQTFSIIKI